MGLYDNIQGHSSGIIDTHVGIPLDALQKSDDILNQRYSETQNNMDALNGTMQTAQGMFKNDKIIMGNQKDQTGAEIKRYMDAGDYEHLGRAVQLTARKFGNTYAQIAANTKGYQDYAQSLQDMMNSNREHEYVDPDKAKLAMQVSLKEYGDGMVQDPTTGRLTNYFHGIVPGASYDTQKETLAGIQAMHPNDRAIQNATRGMVFGGTSAQDAYLNENIINTTSKDAKVLDARRVALASREFLMNSDRLKADVKERGDLKYRAQSREQNVAEFGQLYTQQNGDYQRSQFKKAHPNAGVAELDRVYNHGVQAASSRYSEITADPNFNPASMLAQHDFNRRVGDIAQGNADIMAYSETSEGHGTSGSKRDSGGPPSSGVDIIPSMADIPGSKGGYDGLHEKVVSTAQDVVDLKKDLVGLKSTESKEGSDRSVDIKNLEQKIEVAQVLATATSDKMGYYLKKAGMPFDPHDPRALAGVRATDVKSNANFGKDFPALSGLTHVIGNAATSAVEHLPWGIGKDIPKTISDFAGTWDYKSVPGHDTLDKLILSGEQPKTITSNISIMKDKARQVQYAKNSIPYILNSADTHIDNAEGKLNEPLSTQDLHNFDKIVPVGARNGPGGKPEWISHVYKKGANSGDSPTILQIATPMTAQMVEEWAKAAGLKPQDLQAASAIGDINATTLPHKISNGRGGHTQIFPMQPGKNGVQYEVHVSSPGTKTTIETMGPEQVQEYTARAYSPERHDTDVLLDAQVAQFKKDPTKVVPIIFGNQDNGASFKTIGNGKFHYTSYQKGQAPKESDVTDQEATRLITNLHQVLNR